MEWISVKERVPTNGNLVLMTNTDSDNPEDHWVCAGQINKNGEWSNQFEEEDDVIVTHWMPLPKPPQK